MDYEKKYKEALKRAEKALEVFGTDKCEGARQIFSLFPELKESKDERIRKEIINIFHSLADGKIPSPINFADIFTWLERQEGKHITEPQSRWRPSEEQMKALNAINTTGIISYAGQGQILIELYKDLKNL